MTDAKRIEWPALVVSLLVTFAAAGVGGQFLPDDWYRGLQKPVFQPPDAVFGPVWTLLYTMMAWAAWLVCARGSGCVWGPPSWPTGCNWS